MKLISSKVFLLMILFSSTLVTSQDTSPIEEIGVKNGDTFEYVLTHYAGFDPSIPIFNYGDEEEMYLEVGDTFFLTVIDDSITLGNMIELELWNSEANVTYENSLGIFDFVIFKDWEFWIELINEFDGGAHYQNEEIIQFSFILEDEEDDLFFYFEYIYLKSTGVATHQYIYIADINNPNQPLAIRQINMGVSYVPRPDYNALGFNAGGLYTYDILQLQGYGSEPLFFGIGDNLTLSEGDKFLVSPLTDLVGSVNTIPISIQGTDKGILYENRLDIVYSVESPAFFLFNDWDYIEGVMKSYIDFAPDDVIVSYEFSSNELIYNQDFTSEDSYYSLQLTYDLESGTLLYLSYIFENTDDNDLKILELEQSQVLGVDTSSLKFDFGLSYNYVVVDYKPLSFEDAFFTTESDQLFLFKDDEFSVIALDDPDNDNVLPLRIIGEAGQINLLSQLDVFGSFFIFADWEYWSGLIDLVNEFAGDGLAISYEQSEDLFTFHRTVIGDGFQSDETISYNIDNGVLTYYSYDLQGVTSEGDDAQIVIIFELAGTSKRDSQSDDSDSPSMLIPISIVAFVFAILVKRKYIKNK
jgi:hypothetical protein